MPKRGSNICIMAFLLLTMVACSLPDVRIDKKPKNADNAQSSLFSKADNTSPSGQGHVDKGYLATVHVRFSDSKDAVPINFDISKKKTEMVTFTMWEEKESNSVVHLGYTHSTGGVASIKLTWRF